MEKPSITDPAFGQFLGDLKKQNNQSFATQLMQLKYEREIAKEDNDKREKQLDDVVKSLVAVKDAITGNKVSPKSNQSDPLAKKLSSVQVKADDRTFSEAFKEIKSALTGGTFTAAKGRYSEEFVKAGKGTEEEGMGAYDRIVELEKKLERSKEYGFDGSKEDNEELIKLKDGSVSVANPKVQKRPEGELPATVSSPNAEADNIQSTQEIVAESAKKDVELTGINNDLLEKQLKELEKISAALAPKTPSDLPGSKLTPTSGGGGGGGGGDGGGGGIGLGDMLPSGGGLGKTLKNAGRGALSLGGKALKFMGGKGGAIAGAALAVGAGAYTAYKGYTAADDSKDAKLEEVQAKVDSGEMKPEEAAAARKEIGNTATVEKSGAVGEGTGMAVGAIAGMKAGAMLGAFGGPIGAGVGAIAGGALGAFAGSSAGKYVGEKVGGGINAVKGFFGGKTDAPGAATKEALAPTPATVNAAAVEPDITFRTSKRESSTIGGRVIDGFEGGYNLRGKKEDVEEADAAYNEFRNAEDDATAEAAAAKFKALAANIQSPEYQEKMKRISKEQQARKKAKVDPAVEAQVTGGPGAMIPAVEKKPVDSAAPGDATAAALAPGMAKGGPVEDGADYIVGEKGPELFMPFKDGVVLPNDVSKKIAGGKIPLAKGGIALADSKVKVPPIPKLPAQDGDQDDGSKVTTNPDGTKTYAGAFGRFTFDKSGKAIKYATPQFSGLGSEVDLTSGNQTTSYNAGPMSSTQTTDAKGNIVSSNTEYDLGLGKMSMGQDAKGIKSKSWEGRGGEAQDVVSNKDLYAMGNKDKEATYDRAMAQVNATPATPVGSDVVKASIENKDLERESKQSKASSTPIVMNNSSSNNTTSYVPIKASPRPDGSSSVDRHQNRIAAY